jgi:riboflavin kinase/FMN adenylyltransferase
MQANQVAIDRRGQMLVWRGLDEVPNDWGASAVTIGNFDGVHCGHRIVITRLIERARSARCPAVVVTFDPHPMAVVRPDRAPLLLTTPGQRAALLGELGVDAVCVLPFTQGFSQLSPEEFVRRVLRDRLHAAHVVVGESFRFGYRAAGDLAALRQLGEQHGFTVEGVELVGDGVVTWSSSAVRESVAVGDMAAAQRALGRPYTLTGLVVEGDRRGRELGFPTANLSLPEGLAIPADGVYAGWLAVGGAERPAGSGGARLPAAVSVGTNPTFGGTTRRVEAYVLDRDDLELYGTEVRVGFLDLLRGQVRFDNVTALRDQMAADVRRTREVLAAPERTRHFLA